MARLSGTQIFKILKDINRSPDYYVYQSSKAFFPQLRIDGLGELALPLCDAQAKQLIKLCIKAPYGKGTQTIVDEKVRKVWELDARKLSMGNLAWQTFINRTLRGCEEQLDLQGQTLIAHPYKLLLYEEGSFFLAHQDTEKADGMIATLIVALPSAHQGGELTITHRDKSVCIDFSEKEKLHYFQSVLFYADCHHEVTPVKKGYRLVLSYNICLKGQRKLGSFDFSRQEQSLSRLFKNWKNSLQLNDNKQLIISLDHQYSAAGFSLDTLKGVDRSRADILLHSAQQAGCKAYICLLEKYEMYSAWDEDDIDELIDDYMTVRQLIDARGEATDMEISHVQEKNILRQNELEDDEAIEQDFEGYMGNYGNTLSRWYRHAAIILWPQEYQLEILAHNSINAAISYLEDLHANKDVNFDRDLQTLFSMVDNKLCSPRDESFVLLTLTLDQKDEELARHYCRHFLFAQDSLPAAKKTQQIIELCGWEYLQQSLDMKEQTTRQRLIEILNKIETAPVWKQHPALEKLFYNAIAESSEDNSWRSDANKNLMLIFPLCLELDTEKSANALAIFLVKQSKCLNAEKDVLPYVERQFARLATPANASTFDVVTRWLDAEFKKYRQRIQQEPEPALVETIPNMTCNCDDCQQILSFMQSDKEQIELGRLKAQCEHLDAQIQQHDVQVVHNINKRRRPWRFKMRKLGADQRKKITAYNNAKAIIERLDNLSSLKNDS